VSLLVVVTGPMASGKRTVAPSRSVRLRAADRSTDAVADVIRGEHQ
jgi:predicted kinase